MAGREGGDAVICAVRFYRLSARGGGEEGVATVVEQSSSAGAEFAVVILCVWCSPSSPHALLLSISLSIISVWMDGWW